MHGENEIKVLRIKKKKKSDFFAGLVPSIRKQYSVF